VNKRIHYITFYYISESLTCSILMDGIFFVSIEFKCRTMGGRIIINIILDSIDDHYKFEKNSFSIVQMNSIEVYF